MERERTRISPIVYIEFVCDGCNDEFNNDRDDLEFGMMKNGKLLCQVCRDLRPHHEGLKNFSLDKIFDPEVLDEAQKEFLKMQEPEDLIPDDDRPEGEVENVEELDDAEVAKEEPGPDE